MFHARDAATGKARPPRVNRCTDGTTSVMVVDEWRCMATTFHIGCPTNALSEIWRRWSVETSECQNAETELNPLRDPQLVKVAEKRGDAFEAPGWEYETGGSVEDWACPVDDWRHPPARNSNSRPCWQPKHRLVSAGRVVEDSAAHSESDVVLQSTIWIDSIRFLQLDILKWDQTRFCLSSILS